MKWIGQHIWDLTSRFRNDVYFEGLAETAETRGLVVDADGKVSINPLSGDEHATHIYENVRNDEGATIPVGTPVYSKGEVGASERILVGIADASDPNKMPAIGITNTELTTTGSTRDGLATLVGVYNTNLTGFTGLSVNDIVYVAPSGGLTTSKPAGTNLIQNVGIILKTNGTIIQGLAVTCIGRTNDVPNVVKFRDEYGVDNTSIQYSSNDISTWQLQPENFYVGSTEPTPEAIFFKPDGTKMYILCRSGDDINEYALSTAWDISTASRTDALTGLGSSPTSESNPYGMYISPDGIYLYITGHSVDEVAQYTMSTAWDISTASYTREQDLTDAGGTFSNPTGIHFKPDGTMFWACSYDEDSIQQYTLSTAWDVSTLSVGHSFSLMDFFTFNKLDGTTSSDISSVEDLFFSEDGTKVWVTENSYDSVHQLNLSTAWDITTITYGGRGVRFSPYHSALEGLYVNEAAGKAFTVSTSGDRVRSFNIGGAFFSSANDASVGFESGIGVKGDSVFNGLSTFGDIYAQTGYFYGGFNTYSTTSLTHGNGGSVNILDGTVYSGDAVLDVMTNVYWGANGSDQSVQDDYQHHINLGRPRSGAKVTLNIGRRVGGSGTIGNHTGVMDVVSMAQTFDHYGSLDVGRTLQVDGKPDLEAFDLGGTVVFNDTFTETNTTAIESHTPDLGAGWTKVFDTGSTTTFNIIGGAGYGQLSNSENSDGVIFLADTTPTGVDYEVRVDFKRRDSSDDVFLIIIKYQDANNYYALQWSTSYSTYCKLFRVEGGSVVNVENNFSYGVMNSTSDNLSTALKLRFIENTLVVWDIDSNDYKSFRGSYPVTTDFNDGNGGTYHKVGMAFGDLFGGGLDAATTWKIDKFEVKMLPSAATLAAAGKSYVNAGNFGIGITNPTSKLHVIGDARIQGNLTVNGTYTQIDTDVNTTEQWLVTNDGTGPAAVINQKGSEDIFDVQDDGTSVLYVKDGGNVGIGTTSPNYLLDVESSSASARVYNTAGSTGLFLTCASGYTSHINFGDNTDSNAGRIIYREYDHAMTFTTNTSEAMFIDSSQRVGIGTTSPDSKLHVAGEITAEDQINFKNFGGSLLRFTKDSWTSVPTQDLIYQGWDTTIDDYIYLKAPGNTTTTHGVALIGDGVIALGRTDAETGAPELTSAAAPLDDNWLVLNSTGATFSGGVTISDISGTRGVFRNDNAYDLRLGGGTSYTDGAYVSLSGGMRGGGTSNLKGRVEIRSGGSNYSAQADITGDVVIGTQWNGGTSDILTLDSSTGSVGIGTSSPNSTYKLHVAGKSYLSGGIQMNSGDEIDFGNSNQYITGVNDTSLTLATGGSATLTATHAGNVGIGTASPGYRFVVNSYSADTVAKFESTDSIARLELKDDDDAAYVGTQNNKAFIGMEANATGTNNLIVTSDGKVGIGTNSPSEKLDVTGNIAVSGTVDGVDIGANYANWNTAYSWGNHASAGYLTSSSTQSKYLRSDAVDYFTGKLNWDGADYTDGINMSLGNIRDAHRIDANEFFQLASGRARNNLGDPTVTEMALFEEQFKPQTTLANDYDDLTDLTFWYQETSSSSWVEDTSYSDDQKRKFLRTNNSSVIIPNTYYKFRVEFKAKSYTFANAMYMYWSSQSHRTQVHVWKKRCSDGTWIQHTFSTNTISSWPGHGYLPFSKIAWHETNTTSANHFTHIRFEFIPTWVPYSGSGTDYSTRNINLHGMQIWGGYPTGRRTPHYYDQNGEFNFLKDAHIHDNQTLYIGTGGDLQLYHDGSNSYIDEAGTGNLKIRSNRLQLEKYTGETMAEFIADGASNLYYNNNKKFETTSTGATVTGKLSTTTGLNVVGNTSLDGDLTVNGINYGLYHATTEDGYYSDNYEGSRHLTMFIKNARADIIRYASVGNIEYWNGSSWQDGSSQLANVKKLLDGRQDTSWSVPSTYYKFRFTVSPSTAWPTRAKIGIQTSWSGSTWPGATMLVEEYDGSNWATKVTADFGGQAGGGATPLNSNDNDVDSWGLMFKADNALHTGNGNSSSYNSGLNTRITIDFYGWSPSNPSHVTIPLQNIFITSNYAGTENTDYTNLLDYDRNVAIPNAMTVAGNTTMSGRVDIQKDLRLRGTDAAASQGVVRFYVDNTNKLFIDTANDGSGFFVVDSLGRVGIGTTSPSEKLEVNGKIKATDINFSGLPTSSAGLSAGDVWDDNGTLKIVR